MRQIIFLIALSISFCSTLKADYNNFEGNPYLSVDAKNQIRPFLLPADHPMKTKLDKIFLKARASYDDQALKNAGFDIKFKQPRSFIRVVSHKSMPGYLLKLVTDVELREKKGHPSWYWFVNRCVGVQKIHDVIAKNDIKFFVAPKKWIYPLPLEPAPKKQAKRQLVVLLVEDMQLTSKSANDRAWKKEVTKEHLNELFVIISQVGGRSYRAENIPQTKKGKFAFVDTEYPTSPPRYSEVLHYLSSKNQRKWKEIVNVRRR